MKSLASILVTFAILQGSALATTNLPARKLVCNQGGTVCLAADISNSLIANPLRLDVQVTSRDFVELAWEIRDSTGKLLDTNSTRGRMDWSNENLAPRRTLHLLDFILQAADSDRGTITFRPTRYHFNSSGNPLPILRVPIRLTRRTSVVTTLQPQNPVGFDDEFWKWWFDSPHNPPVFQTDMPFESVQIKSMYFDPDATVGFVAAAVLSRNPGQSPWYVTDWHTTGDTAHIAIKGSGWAGVANYLGLLNYLMQRAMQTIPGIQHVAFD